MNISKKTTYSKICVACNEPFRAQRISTLFCSKKCANNARSMPDSLKVALIKRNNAYILKEDVIAAHLASGETETYIKTHNPSQLDRSLGIKNASKQNPAGDDLGLLIEFARQAAVDRGITPKDVKPSDMVLTEEDVDKDKPKVRFDRYSEATINIDDSLPDPDDDGLGVVNEIAKQQQAKPTFVEGQQDNNKQDTDKEQPVIRKGIRKLGGSK